LLNGLVDPTSIHARLGHDDRDSERPRLTKYGGLRAAVVCN
jgi:hypothetical protein